MPISRGDFLRTGLATIAAAGFGLGCGNASDGGGAGGAASGGAATGGAGGAASGGAATGGAGTRACAEEIVNNHGHVLEVTRDDVLAGVDKTYAIGGNAGHSHDVTLTAADFSKLATGITHTLESTRSEGHVHIISLGCANVRS